MFSSTPSSTSAFGSPLLFGQTSSWNASSTIPIGSLSRGQCFSRNIFGPTSTSAGGTSMGLFGSMQGTPSPPVTWGSSSASMGSSTNGFGSRVGFGQSTNPNVLSTSSFGSQYTFGQSSNLFGSAPNNGGTSMGVFGGSSSGQSSNLFGSAPNNGGTSTGVFGGSLFGQSSNLFGSVSSDGGTSTGLFGQTASGSSFGQHSNIFGSVSNNGGTSTGAFGQTASSSSFGQRSNIFGSFTNNGGTSTGLFATTPSSSPFGFQHTFSSVPASVSSDSIATSSSPILWGSSTGSTTSSQVPASIASTSSGFGSGCMTSSGQTSVPWGRSLLTGTNTFSFGTQSSFSGNQVGAPIFGPLKPDKSSSGEKQGSRVTSYTKTTTKDDKGERNIFVSICAMPTYQDKSHEELRWEDHHQLNGGGGGAVPLPPVPSNPFPRTLNSFLNPLPPSVPSNPFDTTPKPPSIVQNSFLNPAPPSVPSNPFDTTLNPPSIVHNSFLNPAPPSVPSNPFDTTPKPHSIVQNSFLNPAPPSVPSNPFDTTPKPPSIIQNSFLNPAPPSVPSNPFDTTLNPPSIVQNSFLNPAPPSVPSNPFDTTPKPPSIVQPSFLNPAPPSAPYNPFSTAVTTPSIDAAQPYVVPFSPLISPNPSYNNPCSAPSISVTQPVPIFEPNRSPFICSLPTPTAPQYPSINSSSAGAPPVKYGISSIPVCDKPAPARSPSLLKIRHLSYHRQRSLPIQKYNPRSDGPKVAFFEDAQKAPTTAKKEAPLLPRSNPRAFISGLYEELNQRVNFNNTSFEKNSSTDTYKNGEVELLSVPDQDGPVNQDKDGISNKTDVAEHNNNTDSVHGNHPIKKEIASNFYELMPKLKNGDYYFEPRVEELATKESYEPGFCSHVKGFVVGRQGYGSIKFLEETDVRELDLESYIEFRNREVIVYMDESKKPPVGQGLNKAAEITLCNIKVVDKKTGKQYINGPNVDKFKEKLAKKTAQQGAEFVSYNPVQGEWKFRVQHF